MGDSTMHKVMRTSFYCPTLFEDAHAYARKCPGCQKCANQENKSVTPLQPIVVEEPFQQWGLDVISEIFLHSSKQHRYILIATYYFTWRTEAIPLKQVNDQEVINLPKHNIITKFDILTSPFFYNKTYLSSLKLYYFALENGIFLKHLANYYPQGNVLAKSTNKNLICIIKNILFSEQINWHTTFVNSLWVDRVMPKPSINNSPYFLVYGK